MNAATDPPKKNGLLWFRHDLRLHDNAALTALCQQVQQLICVFVIDPQWLRPSCWQSQRIGSHRRQFLAESLINLDALLSNHGQKLYVLQGAPQQVLPNIIGEYSITHVASNWHPGVYEQDDWSTLIQQCQTVQFDQYSGHTLFDFKALPFELDKLPASFTPFRKQVESAAIDPPFPAPAQLPPGPQYAPATVAAFDISSWTTETNKPSSTQVSMGMAFQGGESAALQQLSYYLGGSKAVTTYKQTRNGLDGWDYSSKLSPWLANGCLSVRQALFELRRFEQQEVANESTYWLFFELLWREYFQWYLAKHQARLFAFAGVKNQKPLTTFYPGRFAQWCDGNTPYPIVNAAMRQLKNTGYMSNRARQLVASCFVHELELDWRYGAAYFEEQLLDFDVGSNWGNWQYLAGVGADPRGHRRFDLNKQTQIYDPDQAFIQAWEGNQTLPIDSVDAADWPLTPVNT